MSNESLRALVGNIQKFSTEDGPGIRSTVFLKGCPLACKWCHNPELIDFSQQLIRIPNNCIHCGYCIEDCPKEALYVSPEGEIRVDLDKCDHCLLCTKACYALALQPVATEMTVEEVIAEVALDKRFYENTGGGMTVSGGEMLSQPSFVEALIDAAEKESIGVCLDTSGFGDGNALYHMAAREAVTDILFDIKHLDCERHRELTAQGNDIILANLRRLCKNPDIRRKIQIRLPLIAGLNDDAQEIDALVALLSELDLHRATLLPYHNLGLSKKRHLEGEQTEFTPPSDARVEEIRTILENSGVTVEILGKV